MKSFSILLFITIISVQSLAQSRSLYTDSLRPYTSPIEQPLPRVLTNTDQHPLSILDDSLYVSEEPAEASLLTRYKTVVFSLSQLIDPIGKTPQESLLFSDIKRLEDITVELRKKMDLDGIIQAPDTATFQHTGQHQLRSRFASMSYTLISMTPTINTWIQEDTYSEFLSTQVSYLEAVLGQLNRNIVSSIHLQNQMAGLPPGSLPFSPQSPEQLNLALTSQLNNSLLSAFGTSNSSGSAGLGFGQLAAPASPALPQANAPGGLQNFPGGFGQPLPNTPLGLSVMGGF